MTSIHRGRLYLIVGPSGAGKDTLIAASRQHLAKTHVFPCRTITRSNASAEEDHIAVTVDSFMAQERAGQFALSWKAHGLNYAIPSSILDDLNAGLHVVANVSREVIEQAKHEFDPVRVILVTAPAGTLALRLSLRGREAPSQIATRLARARDVAANTTIVNDGPLETALKAFIEALRS